VPVPAGTGLLLLPFKTPAMKKLLFLSIALFLSSFAVEAQKTNDQIVSQIRNKKIKLTFEGGTTKLMAVAENFPDSEAKSAKVVAMNFAVGFFYTGRTLERMPDEMLLTFWVMSKKPVFAERHSLTIYADGEEILLGEGRYSARARENMEYLNFNVSRDALVKVASTSNVHLKIGDSTFKFTSDQMRMLADLLEASDPMIN
jgi:hypothetical protein